MGSIERAATRIRKRDTDLGCTSCRKRVLAVWCDVDRSLWGSAVGRGGRLPRSGPIDIPLGEGDFDVLPFLQQLRASGYEGPIGLQCYQVPGKTDEILKKSIRAWRVIAAKNPVLFMIGP